VNTYKRSLKVYEESRDGLRNGAEDLRAIPERLREAGLVKSGGES
jgi:hypothetical protein